MRQTSSKRHYQRHPEINKIARWAIWHIFLTLLNAPYFASKTEKFAVSASLRSAPSVCKWVSLVRGQRGKERTRKETTVGDLFSCWLPPNVLARFWTSNHATNFEPCGSRRQKFKRNSAPCPRLWRAGWSVRVQEGEPTKKPRHLSWFSLAPPAGLEPATP